MLRYPNKPIASVAALARTLGFSEKSLQGLARRSDSLYRLSSKGIERKPNGDEKIYYEPKHPLKELQCRINERILSNVEFPLYLSPARGRGYRDEILQHGTPKIVVGLDIRTFFESVSAKNIRAVWQHFFHFAPPVAGLLTQLTTHNGALPRGAPSSSGLANLLFWDCEPQVIDKLASLGFRYTRYADNVTLSGRTKPTQEQVRRAIGAVYDMFDSKGLSPNYDKESVEFSHEPMVVHNIHVNGPLPSIPKPTRREVRAAVHGLRLKAQREGTISDEDRARHRQLSGRVAWVAQFHPKTGDKLRQILSEAERPDE